MRLGKGKTNGTAQTPIGNCTLSWTRRIAPPFANTTLVQYNMIQIARLTFVTVISVGVIVHVPTC